MTVGGDAGVLAAVLLVDVLHHLLAPLVLEIDVDVGRLVALARDEALEEQVDALRIDLGDAEAVADGGVGRRAAALAEDPFLAREPHDVVDGEEIGLVFEILDDRELVLDEFLDAVRDAAGIAPVRAEPGETHQLVIGRCALAGRFQRVFVIMADFVEREVAAARAPRGFR